MTLTLINNLMNKMEPFQNMDKGNAVNKKQTNYGQMMILLVMVVLWISLVLLVGKYLWNECLCKVVSVCKPVDNVFVLLGLVVLFDILHPQM